MYGLGSRGGTPGGRFGGAFPRGNDRMILIILLYMNARKYLPTCTQLGGKYQFFIFLYLTPLQGS